MKKNYLQNHIKGARFIDLDKDLIEMAKMRFGGRHPLQRFQNLQKPLQNLGITEDSHIIVYMIWRMVWKHCKMFGCW